jgi:N-carbamoyl-L-amino-acid hydrolase
MEISPNSPNTIAETVRLWVELRSDDQAALSAAAAGLKTRIASLRQDTGCEVEFETESHRNVTEFYPRGCDIVEAAASAAGLRTARMSTIAGHDVINLQAMCPSSLIFVPSKDGISHAPDEFTSDADVIAGYEASLAAIAALLITPP